MPFTTGWTKQDIIDDINLTHVGAGDPENPPATPNGLPEGEKNGVIKYIVNAHAVGKSQENIKPSGRHVNITFFVCNEGKPDEFAWYEGDEPHNEANRDITAASDTGLSYEIIFKSVVLRRRVLGFIDKAIVAIINEDAATENHSLRLKWAYDALKEPVKYLDAYMVHVSNNPVVRSNGNLVLDSAIEWIINSSILVTASAFGIVN